LFSRSNLCRLHSKRVNLLSNHLLHPSRLNNLKVNLNSLNNLSNPNNLNRLNNLNSLSSQDNLSNPSNHNNRLSLRPCPDQFGVKVAFSVRAGESWLS
jgi:hypothetical protein